MFCKIVKSMAWNRIYFCSEHEGKFVGTAVDRSAFVIVRLHLGRESRAWIFTAAKVANFSRTGGAGSAAACRVTPAAPFEVVGPIVATQ